MNLQITEKQNDFIKAAANEVLFGGAAGGGKSYGQIVDAFLYALKYPRSKQLILRRTYVELEKSLIRVSRDVYPQEISKYNDAKHTYTFANGSLIDFGYCQNSSDVYQYQSAEYDVIRFDELTHFTDDMYLYLISRCRGANDYPKQIKSTSNPGNIGHSWVKKRFVDVGPWGKTHNIGNGTRLFIPAKIQDNNFLMAKDPQYLMRLENLPDRERNALLYGDWDIFDGQYFTEFDRAIHVISPCFIPPDWRRYRTIDYGLDMLACYWIAVDFAGHCYVYRELYESNLIVSAAATRIAEMTIEDIHATFAPPDLWNPNRDTGKSTAEKFLDCGIKLNRASNERVAGWLNVREWLKIYKGEQGETTADLRIFNNCTNLIRCIGEIQVDEKNPNDCATEPHELTHAPDALRYFLAGRPKGNRVPIPPKHYNFECEKPKPHPLGYGTKIEVIK